MNIQIVPYGYFSLSNRNKYIDFYDVNELENKIIDEEKSNYMYFRDTIPETGDYDDIVDYQNDFFINNVLMNNQNLSLYVYAMNYNILRVMGGLGGLEYSS